MAALLDVELGRLCGVDESALSPVRPDDDARVAVGHVRIEPRLVGVPGEGGDPLNALGAQADPPLGGVEQLAVAVPGAGSLQSLVRQTSRRRMGDERPVDDHDRVGLGHAVRRSHATVVVE